MSAEGQEELLDYSDSEEIAVTQPATTTEGGDKEADKKGSYVGIHATGFRDFLLKPELLRAIGDCGFEHPSEGSYITWESSSMKSKTIDDCTAEAEIDTMNAFGISHQCYWENTQFHPMNLDGRMV